ncbi:hypothetical protein J6590_068882 [Homalodisca vitripennis]|nr:hypothetical protein J6590_068882 [Homalodisca vitripennis]
MRVIFHLASVVRVVASTPQPTQSLIAVISRGGHHSHSRPSVSLPPHFIIPDNVSVIGMRVIFHLASVVRIVASTPQPTQSLIAVISRGGRHSHSRPSVSLPPHFIIPDNVSVIGMRVIFHLASVVRVVASTPQPTQSLIAVISRGGRHSHSRPSVSLPPHFIIPDNVSVIGMRVIFHLASVVRVVASTPQPTQSLIAVISRGGRHSHSRPSVSLPPHFITILGTPSSGPLVQERQARAQMTP